MSKTIYGHDIGPEADLRGADLREADLRKADLREANLRRANLTGADLRGADLREADLRGANLTGADLRGADLREADLRWANLTGADLREADLREANLTGADLRGADLTGTCLDPARTDRSTAEQLTAAGLRVEGEYAYGWRTAKSQHVGSTVYEPGHTYTAPVFSVCTDTPCHPGIYLASKEWLNANAYSPERVRVRALVKDCIVAGDKIRARKVEVL